MGNFLKDLTGTDKTIIGSVHLLPLPGTPQHDASGGLRRIVELARQDAKRLIQGGIDAILFVNEGDRPYAAVADAGLVATMAAVVAEVAGEVTVPHGANILVDPAAAIAVAHATGGGSSGGSWLAASFRALDPSRRGHRRSCACAANGARKRCVSVDETRVRSLMREVERIRRD
jgi:predicted TIM-barrel enzyme